MGLKKILGLGVGLIGGLYAGYAIAAITIYPEGPHCDNGCQTTWHPDGYTVCEIGGECVRVYTKSPNSDSDGPSGPQ